ncbi:plasmid recombination protein (plasmid) [Acidithiobacillus sp. YTS05]|nr:plasmid recombination protein [Acidithiobacillus sp. YTS05]
MSRTISVRVQPQTGRLAAGQKRHDLRDPAHVPGYVDRQRTAQNSIYAEAPDPETLRKEIQRNRQKAHQQQLRADARITVAGIITFGHEAQAILDTLPKEQHDKIFQTVATAISAESGHPLLGLVIHRDESALHAHFTLRGYRLDEQGHEQPWRKSRTDLARLQDVAAACVQDLGIERGERKEDKAQRLRAAGVPGREVQAATIHRSVRALHQDLPQEIAAKRKVLEKELADLEAKAQKNRRLIQEQERKLEAGRVSEEKARQRIEAYERREREALEKIAALENEAQDWQTRVQAADKAAQQAEQAAAKKASTLADLTAQEQALRTSLTQLEALERHAEERATTADAKAHEKEQRVAALQAEEIDIAKRIDAQKAAEIDARARVARLHETEQEAQARVMQLRQEEKAAQQRVAALRETLREQEPKAQRLETLLRDPTGPWQIPPSRELLTSRLGGSVYAYRKDEIDPWLENTKQWALHTQDKTQQETEARLAAKAAELEQREAQIAQREAQVAATEKTHAETAAELTRYQNWRNRITLTLAARMGIASMNRGKVWDYIEQQDSLPKILSAIDADIQRGKIAPHEHYARQRGKDMNLGQRR